MRGTCVLVVFFAGAAPAADTDRFLKVSAPRGLPAIESATVYRAKDGKREVIGDALTNFEKAQPLPDDGPFEVWVKPKGGIAVKALSGVSVKAGQTHELKLGDVLGTVEVFGDNFPVRTGS